MTKRNALMRSAFLVMLACLFAGNALSQSTVERAMDGIVTRLYATHSPDQLYAITDADVQKVLTPDERRVLATKHWYFDVDVPVVVSVLHDIDQEVVPFWLPESGFSKTDMRASNVEGWVYEVWQKKFPAGRVELGINGFDNFRPHYLVCVGPQTPGAHVTLSGFHPESQTVVAMQPGALTYYDWTELVLKDVPEALLGQQLLPTTRGRAVESCLVKSFRKTPFPSSEKPEPVYLTWSDDPRTTQTVQWRTSTHVEDGVVRYRKKGGETPFAEAPATSRVMDDRMLANDRTCRWFAATLRDLEPGAAYEYRVGSPKRDVWSDGSDFTTAPGEPAPFSFFWCSDTHSHESWGDLLEATLDRYPKAAFCTVSGDLVPTGMERDGWDRFLAYGEPMFRRRPIMPAIGNHDSQLGLGPGMYLDIFNLPHNGPKEIEPGHAYTFKYSNAEFFVLDVMSDTMAQRPWLRDQLAASKAAWKFAIFHFPLYSQELEYAGLQQEWGTLFDEFHVDIVLTGHVHTHLRTYPMYAGHRAESPAKGTVYITSVSIPGDPANEPKPDFAETWIGGGAFCDVFEIDGNRCTLRAVTADGSVKDSMTIEK